MGCSDSKIQPASTSRQNYRSKTSKTEPHDYDFYNRNITALYPYLYCESSHTHHSNYSHHACHNTHYDNSNCDNTNYDNT